MVYHTCCDVILTHFFIYFRWSTPKQYVNLRSQLSTISFERDTKLIESDQTSLANFFPCWIHIHVTAALRERQVECSVIWCGARWVQEQETVRWRLSKLLDSQASCQAKDIKATKATVQILRSLHMLWCCVQEPSIPIWIKSKESVCPSTIDPYAQALLMLNQKRRRISPMK